MTEELTGKQNPLFKHVRKLRDSRAYRYEQRQFLADGVKLVQEALRWGTELRTVVLQRGVTLDGIPEHVRTVIVPESVMKDLSRMDTPQGVLAVCAMPDELPFRAAPGMLALDGIQDPGNLGTILRTADALEIPLILTEGCADPYGEKTVRASMGAVFRTPVIRTSRERLIAACRESGVRICATALRRDAADLRQLALREYLLVIGSEGRGVSEELLNAAQRTCVIPMSERCESLNAAIAAAIVMWQMKR